jgi:hypothetical protein
MNSNPSIGGEKFQIKMNKETLKSYGSRNVLTGEVKMQVLSEPKPYSRENKSRWKIVNWWKKLVGTYYESGYIYTVKLIEDDK